MLTIRHGSFTNSFFRQRFPFIQEIYGNNIDKDDSKWDNNESLFRKKVPCQENTGGSGYGVENTNPMF